MASASVVLSAANGPRVDEWLPQRSARMNEDPGGESSPERTPHDAVLGWVEPLGRYVNVDLHPRARITLEVLVYWLDDRRFTGNASYVRGRIRAEGAHQLPSGKGNTLVVARLKGPTQRTFRDVGLPDMIGEGHIYPTMRAAVQALGPERDGA